MTFGEKIRNARKAKDYTQKQLADKIGAKHNSVSDWENNKNMPDPNTIEFLCGVLEITPNYLLDASEEEFSPFEKLFVKKYRNLDDFGKESVEIILNRETERVKQIRWQEEYIESLKSEVSAESFPTRIWAYYGKIASAGTSVEFTDMVAGTKEYPVTKENESADYTIGVNGNSMEPLYNDGDVVFVKHTTHLHIGDIGIFQKDNNIYIKQVGENCLVSLNSNYDPIKIGDGIRVWGKVLGKATEPVQKTNKGLEFGGNAYEERTNRKKNVTRSIKC